jgi:hypothetical protein
MPGQKSGSQSAAGTREPRRDGREGAPVRSAAWDGGGDELRGLGVDGDIAPQQHAADDMARVPGRVLLVGGHGHVSSPS